MCLTRRSCDSEGTSAYRKSRTSESASRKPCGGEGASKHRNLQPKSDLITPSFNSPSRVVYPVKEEHEGEKSPAPRPEPYGERQQDNLKYSIQDCSSDVNLRNDLVVPDKDREETTLERGASSVSAAATAAAAAAAAAQIQIRVAVKARVNTESLVPAKVRANTEIYNQNRILITRSFNSPSRVVYPVQEEHEGGRSPAPRPEPGPYGERQQDNVKHSIQDCSSDVNLRNDLVVPKEVRVESLVTEKARVNTEILAAVKAQQLRLFQGSQLMVQIEGMLLMCRFMLLVCAINVVRCGSGKQHEGTNTRRI